jgi:hypothetical protein
MNAVAIVLFFLGVFTFSSSVSLEKTSIVLLYITRIIFLLFPMRMKKSRCAVWLTPSPGARGNAVWLQA